MSEGPIKAWRDSWKPPTISTPQSTAVHGAGPTLGRAYCGRKTHAVTGHIGEVTCADCLAGIRADAEPRG